MNSFPVRNRCKRSESENGSTHYCNQADQLSSSSSAQMNTLTFLSKWSDQSQLLKSIQSPAGLIDSPLLLGLFLQVMFLDSMFFSFTRIFQRRHACLYFEIKVTKVFIKPLQTVQLIIFFVFGVPALETRIPARGQNRHSDCSHDSCVRSIGGMPCACLPPSNAVCLAQIIARCFNLGCAWRKVTASTELT
jgi:hypothetical protein